MVYPNWNLEELEYWKIAANTHFSLRGIIRLCQLQPATPKRLQDSIMVGIMTFYLPYMLVISIVLPLTYQREKRKNQIFVFRVTECTFRVLERTFYDLEYTFRDLEYRLYSSLTLFAVLYDTNKFPCNYRNQHSPSNYRNQQIPMQLPKPPTLSTPLPTGEGLCVGLLGLGLCVGLFIFHPKLLSSDIFCVNLHTT